MSFRKYKYRRSPLPNISIWDVLGLAKPSRSKLKKRKILYKRDQGKLDLAGKRGELPSRR